jgi:hypothetical protein
MGRGGAPALSSDHGTADQGGDLLLDTEERASGLTTVCRLQVSSSRRGRPALGRSRARSSLGRRGASVAPAQRRDSARSWPGMPSCGRLPRLPVTGALLHVSNSVLNRG